MLLQIRGRGKQETLRTHPWCPLPLSLIIHTRPVRVTHVCRLPHLPPSRSTSPDRPESTDGPQRAAFGGEGGRRPGSVPTHSKAGESTELQGSGRPGDQEGALGSTSSGDNTERAPRPQGPRAGKATLRTAEAMAQLPKALPTTPLPAARARVTGSRRSLRQKPRGTRTSRAEQVSPGLRRPPQRGRRAARVFVSRENLRLVQNHLKLCICMFKISLIYKRKKANDI